VRARIEIEDPDTLVSKHVEDVPLEWILSQDGVYGGRFVPSEAGEHKITVSARYAGSDETFDLKTSFLVGESYIEFSPGWQNATFLKALAERTGGRYHTEADALALIEELSRQIEQSAGARAEITRHDLWDMPVLFVLLVGVLSVEWLIKRRSGLP